jgi:hypothetical protein
MSVKSSVGCYYVYTNVKTQFCALEYLRVSNN